MISTWFCGCVIIYVFFLKWRIYQFLVGNMPSPRGWVWPWAARPPPTVGQVILVCSSREKVTVKIAQSRPTLWDAMDCSPPASCIHGILQTGILEWVAVPFYRGSSQPTDWTLVSLIAGRFFTSWAPREALEDAALSSDCHWRGGK